jgi:MFS family permease
LAASVGDAAGVSAMIGLGETYFAAFALALGTGETFAGLVATLPMLAGATLQLATPKFLAKQRSYKKWVVACVCLQAAALLSMPLAAFFSGSLAAICIFAAATFYWAGSQASGPAWNTWVEELIPRRLRARFLAFRARISQACTLAGFAIGGLALQAGKSSGWLLAAFTAIFLIGSSCRFMSAWFLNRHSEPSHGKYSLRQVPMREAFFRSHKTGGRTPIVLYLLAMQAAVQISGPYFAPYMLGQREMSYLDYMVLVGIGYLGKVIALPLWGRVAHRAGAPRLLWIGGTSIVPIAGLWLGSDFFASWPTSRVLEAGAIAIPVNLSAEFVYIGLVQLISGIVWAAYELAMLLMFFEAIPRQDRASVMTYYNFGNAAAQVAGGLIGAAILQIGHESHAAYLAVFGISSLVRLSTVPLLRSVNSRARTVQPSIISQPNVVLRETPEPV